MKLFYEYIKLKSEVLLCKIIGKLIKPKPKPKLLLGRWNLKYNHMKYYENKDYPY